MGHVFFDCQGGGEPMSSVSVWVNVNVKCFCDSCFSSITKKYNMSIIGMLIQ